MHSPCFSEILKKIEIFGNAKQKIKDDVAEIKMIKDLQIRSFS